MQIFAVMSVYCAIALTLSLTVVTVRSARFLMDPWMRNEYRTILADRYSEMTSSVPEALRSPLPWQEPLLTPSEKDIGFFLKAAGKDGPECRAEHLAAFTSLQDACLETVMEKANALQNRSPTYLLVRDILRISRRLEFRATVESLRHVSLPCLRSLVTRVSQQASVGAGVGLLVTSFAIAFKWMAFGGSPSFSSVVFERDYGMALLYGPVILAGIESIRYLRDIGVRSEARPNVELVARAALAALLLGLPFIVQMVARIPRLSSPPEGLVLLWIWASAVLSNAWVIRVVRRNWSKWTVEIRMLASAGALLAMTSFFIPLVVTFTDEETPSWASAVLNGAVALIFCLFLGGIGVFVIQGLVRTSRERNRYGISLGIGKYPRAPILGYGVVLIALVLGGLAMRFSTWASAVVLYGGIVLGAGISVRQWLLRRRWDRSAASAQHLGTDNEDAEVDMEAGRPAG